MSLDAQALSVKVWTGSNANLVTLTTAMNTFLAGGGTPAITATTKLLQVDIRNDGSVFFATILYVE